MTTFTIDNPAAPIFFLGVAVGAAAAATVVSTFFLVSNKPTRSPASSTVYADDQCYSLYYDKKLGPEGTGMPYRGTCEKAVRDVIYNVKPEFKFLPRTFYGDAVQFLPTVCVDVICRRKTDGKMLLFFRRDAPAAGIWWWPGGRAFRGESFFQTAVRKTADETGISADKVSTIAVLQVWNTFFPDSSWDAGRQPGYEGCQTVNIIVVCELDAPDVHITEETKEKWAVCKHRWVSAEEALVPGKFDKYVRLNVELARNRGFI